MVPIQCRATIGVIEMCIRDRSILGQVEKKDVLLSYPFESMKPFIKMLNDAAEDPDVVSICLLYTS